MDLNEMSKEQLIETVQSLNNELNRTRAILALVDREVARGVSFSRLLVDNNTLQQQVGQLNQQVQYLDHQLNNQNEAKKEPAKAKTEFESGAKGKKGKVYENNE